MRWCTLHDKECLGDCELAVEGHCRFRALCELCYGKHNEGCPPNCLTAHIRYSGGTEA